MFVCIHKFTVYFSLFFLVFPDFFTKFYFLVFIGAIKKIPNIEQQSSTNSQAATTTQANSSTNVSNQQGASNNPVATSIVNLDPNSKVPVQVIVILLIISRMKNLIN